MFEITVFSNPVTALVGEGGLLKGDELHAAAEYDEEFVKPALLLADKVTLRSHRVDLIGNQIRDHNMLGYPVPLLSRAMGISARRDPSEIGRLGLRDVDLLTESEIAAIEAVMHPGSAGWGTVIPEALERVEPFRVALRDHFRAHGELLSSQPLRDLGEILVEMPWDPTPKTQPQKIRDGMAGENAEFERAFFTMIDDVASSRTSVMMDDTVFDGVKRLRDEPADLGSAIVVRGAVDLMRMVDGLSGMRLDEIPGVRDDLAAYIGPFRSFMLDVSSKSDLDDVSDAERSRQLLIAWEREVEPAIESLEALLKTASFKRNAIDVFAESGELLRTTGVAIGIAVASGLVGISSLSAGAALATPLLKALVGSVRAKQASKRNRAYFVHAMATRRKRRA